MHVLHTALHITFCSFSFIFLLTLQLFCWTLHCIVNCTLLEHPAVFCSIHSNCSTFAFRLPYAFLDLHAHNCLHTSLRPLCLVMSFLVYCMYSGLQLCKPFKSFALDLPYAPIVACTRQWHSEHLYNLGHCTVTPVWMSPFTGSVVMHPKYDEQGLPNAWKKADNYVFNPVSLFGDCI